jgi:hypothetical protein
MVVALVEVRSPEILMLVAVDGTVLKKSSPRALL